MIGWFVIIVTQMMTGLLWLAAKAISPSLNFAQGGAQILGLMGIMCLAWTFILAIRSRLIENLFGGLDWVYKAHHILGGLAMIALLNHVLFLIVGAMPANMLKLYLIPGTSWDYTFGQLSLYTMLGLIVLTLFVKLPYRFWKWSHEWMGMVIIFGGLHGMLVSSDTARFMPLRYWILSWSGLATVAYLYKRFGYYFYPKPIRYRVVTRGRAGDLSVIKLESAASPIVFEAGQYGFFSLTSRVRDEHPFSILGSEGSTLIVGVKVIGTFTNELANLQVDQEVFVRGPYGKFGEKMQQVKHAVWIAGGIGITPFLSMAKSVKQNQQIEMYFCARVMPPKVITEPFKVLADKNDNFHWLPCETSKDGRITGRKIYESTGQDKSATYLLCGPKAMMEEIARELAMLGIRRSKIVYEDFAFK